MKIHGRSYNIPLYNTSQCRKMNYLHCNISLHQLQTLPKQDNISFSLISDYSFSFKMNSFLSLKDYSFRCSTAFKLFRLIVYSQ